MDDSLLEDEIFGGGEDLSDFEGDLGELDEELDELVQQQPSKDKRQQLWEKLEQAEQKRSSLVKGKKKKLSKRDSVDQPSSTSASAVGSVGQDALKQKKQKRIDERRKRRRRSEQQQQLRGDDQLLSQDQQQQQEDRPKLSAAMQEFEDTLQSLKHKRSRMDFDEADADEAIDRIINDMRRAAEDDRDSNHRKEPAFEKLKLLPKVISLLEKSYLHDQLLEHEILEAIHRWLEPLPDGSLPAINIRRSLLLSLAKMPITMENLRGCKLGRVIMFEYMCERELPELRKVAGELISLWTRPLLVQGANRAQQQQQQRRLQQQQQQGMMRDGADAGVDGDEDRMRVGEINYGAKHARIPQSIRATYQVMPRSLVGDYDPKDKAPSKYKKISQQLGRGKGKGESRLNKVSVEGRGMQ